MDTLEAFENKGYISIAEDEEMQIKELREGLNAAEKGLEAANAENAILRELLRKNGIDFTV
ncbi:MAG: hypothetical protein HUK21_11910 [Fibrobacteraceae bacterium]|nr:hypothetical protein [Fibrobacteraceae bacterium]MCF0215710.1 hypothetical protein [Fibrobacteraceae bacterium]MCF0217160.1 hypothetical protein [Fibrobacteraceae bacterium]